MYLKWTLAPNAAITRSALVCLETEFRSLLSDDKSYHEEPVSLVRTITVLEKLGKDKQPTRANIARADIARTDLARTDLTTIYCFLSHRGKQESSVL